MLAPEFLPETILSNVPIKEVVGVFLALNICAWLIIFVSRNWSGKTARASTPDLEKPAAGVRGKVTRPPGGRYIHGDVSRSNKDTYIWCVVWTPSDFKRPTAAPYPGWDVHSTKPIPYRPFRYGP